MRFLNALRQRREQYGFFGDYPSFAEAARLCGLGYTNPSTIAYARTHTTRTDHLLSIDLPVLAALQTARPRRVLDFGGGLGGHYFRLNHLVRAEEWRVVELPGTAAIGSAEYAGGGLSFSTEPAKADLVLAGGSLQYTEDPYRKLSELATLAPYLIVDRLPLIERDKVTIQRVDPALFDGAVPAWFLSKMRFLEATSRFATVMSWDHHEPFMGFLFRTGH